MENKKSQSIILFYTLSLVVLFSLFFFSYDISKDYKERIILENDKLKVQNSFFSMYSKIIYLTSSLNSSITISNQKILTYQISYTDDFIYLYYFNKNMNFEIKLSNIIPFCSNYVVSSTKNIKYLFDGNCISIE
jgi:hypothetical protein